MTIGPAEKAAGVDRKPNRQPRPMQDTISVMVIEVRILLKWIQLSRNEHISIAEAIRVTRLSHGSAKKTLAITSQAPAGLGIPRKKPFGVIAFERP